jgi:hypothetical protein
MLFALSVAHATQRNKDGLAGCADSCRDGYQELDWLRKPEPEAD